MEAAERFFTGSSTRLKLPQTSEFDHILSISPLLS